MKWLILLVVSVGCGTVGKQISSDPVVGGQIRQAAWVYETCVANGFGGEEEKIACREWSNTYCPEWYKNCGTDRARTETDTRWSRR